MSFNPDDFNISGGSDDITPNQITKLNQIYLKKTELDTSTCLTTFNNDLIINSNLVCNGINISKDELDKLNNIDTNIKNKLDLLQSSIGGVYTANNSYSGDNIYLGSSAFNQMTLTNNGITKTLNSFELSQLDNISSNIQTQLNNKNNLITNSTNNNLVSMNSLGQCINNNVAITIDENLNTTSNVLIPSSTAIKNYVDNKINQISTISTIGQAILLYFSNTSNNIVGYEDLLYQPDTSPQDIEMIALNNNRVLLHSYATSNLNRTIIPSGIYSFNFYCYVNDNASLTRFEIELYKYSNGGTLTQFGDIIYSPDVNLLTVSNFTFNYTLQNNISCNLTDKLVIKIYGYSNVSNKTINLYFYHSGNQYNSFVSTPFIYKHNDLSNLNDGDYQHLTQTQKQLCTQYSSISNDGLLSYQNFNIFNDKQNFISPTTSNDVYFGDKSFKSISILKSNMNLGNVDNTSDINKPISNLTQIALNNKNDLITSSSNLIVNNIIDNVGNLRTGINNLTNKFYQIYFVAGQFGSDSNNGYTINTPKQTIMSAINDASANSGVIIIILPWVYTETITINKANITISAFSLEKGGLCSLSTVNITTTTSSVRLNGLNITTLNITGTTNVYIDYCKISSFSKTSNNYLEMTNSNVNTSFYFDCNAIMNFYNNNMPCLISNSANCTSSQVNFSNNLLLGPMTLNSGIIGINNSPVYSSSSTNSAITTNLTFLYLTNLTLLNPDNSYAKISISNSSYSITNVIYNKTSSVFTNSTKYARDVFFENIYLDNITLNNNKLLSSTNKNIQFIDVSDTIVNLNSAQTLTNKTLTSPILNSPNITNISFSSPKLLDNQMKTSLDYIITIPNSTDTLVNLSSNQTLNNKILNDPVLLNNKLLTGLLNTITFVESNDTIVNLNSIQTLTNKTLNNPVLLFNKLISSTNKNIQFIDVSDTIVNLNSIQTLTNKILVEPVLGTNIIKSQSGGTITIPSTTDTLLNQNSIQTMTNKTLTDCDVNTQLTSNNSTKIASTAYVKNLLATPNSYVNTQSASATSFTLTTTYQDIASITIPVAGTYEITMNIFASADQGVSISNILYNSTNSSDVPNSFYQTVSYNSGVRIAQSITKSLIIENITANTVYKIRSKASSINNVNSYIYNDGINGYTYISYKILGLTANVPLTTRWGAFGTSLTFGNYYTISMNTSTTTPYLRCSSSSALYLQIYTSNSLVYSSYLGGSSKTLLVKDTDTNCIYGMVLSDGMAYFGHFANDADQYFRFSITRVSGTKFAFSVDQLI